MRNIVFMELVSWWLIRTRFGFAKSRENKFSGLPVKQLEGKVSWMREMERVPFSVPCCSSSVWYWIQRTERWELELHRKCYLKFKLQHGRYPLGEKGILLLHGPQCCCDILMTLGSESSKRQPCNGCSHGEHWPRQSSAWWNFRHSRALTSLFLERLL